MVITTENERRRLIRSSSDGAISRCMACWSLHRITFPICTSPQVYDMEASSKLSPEEQFYILFFIMYDEAEIKKQRTLGEVLKDIFDWYPTDYPPQERKWVSCAESSNMYWYMHRLLFKLDLSILVFACICCKNDIPVYIRTELTTTQFSWSSSVR